MNTHPRYHSNCGETPPLQAPVKPFALTRQIREGSTCFRFLPSGSGVTADGLFPRLAPTAASLIAEVPSPSPSRPLTGVYAFPCGLSTFLSVFYSFRLIIQATAPAVPPRGVRGPTSVPFSRRDTASPSCRKTARPRPAVPPRCRRYPSPA